MDLVTRLTEVLGARQVRELTGGHQSRAFEAVVASTGRRVVAKVRDAGDAHRAVLDARMSVVAELAEVEPMVCRPVLLDRELVLAIPGEGDRPALATCVEHAAGPAPSPTSRADAKAMGAGLARLHGVMAEVRARDIPVLAALEAIGVPVDGPVQLLHGDFGTGNIRQTPDGLRVFDFDECGYGPPLFDVANAIYMVAFDGFTNVGESVRGTFEPAFLEGYAEGSGTAVDPDEVARFFDLRVDALAAWLDDLPAAPVGIRRSSAGWHETLRAFVDRQRRDRR